MPIDAAALRRNLAARQVAQKDIEAKPRPVPDESSTSRTRPSRADSPRQSKPKSLPHSHQAEQAVLAVMLQFPDSIPTVIRSVTARHHDDPRNKTIFQALCDLHESGSVGLIELTQRLRDNGKLDEVGGAPYVTELQTMTVVAESVSYYMDILREKYARRCLITLADNARRGAFGESNEISELLQDFSWRLERIKRDSGGPNGSILFEWEALQNFDSKHDPDCLIGNRWIVRGDASLWAGGSGYGKSSLEMQLALYWASGQSCFGLRPVRPLKSLILQAENNLGDVSEQYRGAIAGITATGDLQIEGFEELIQRNVGIHRVIGKTGAMFLALLDSLIEIDRPDIVWIDPLFAFAGCDLMNAEKTGRFLREGLFPIAVKRKIGLNVVHHAGKPAKDSKGGPSSEIDYQYLGFGTSEIQNAFRVVNILVPVEGAGFKLVLSKRGERAGAKDLDGHHTRTLFLKHSKENIAWLQTEATEKVSRSTYDPQDILAQMSVVHGVKASKLQERMDTESGMKPATFWRLWKVLKNKGKIRTDPEDNWYAKPTDD